MTAARIDPFTDRPARLLRNRLARALHEALTAGSPEPFRRQARQLQGTVLEPDHRLYLEERLSRYEDAFAEIRRQRIRQPFEQALVLWDHGLYFEVHEVLESLWLAASGERRPALQAMIRAAGVYVHLELDHPEAARRMADKAVAGLEAHGTALPPFPGFSRLLTALRRLGPVAPRLRRPSASVQATS